MPLGSDPDPEPPDLLRPKYLIPASIFPLVMVLDLFTKRWALEVLGGASGAACRAGVKSIEMLGGLVPLTLAYNKGAAFGIRIGEDSRWFFQALYDPDRISGPLVRTGERGAGQWEEISWTDAVSRLAHQLQQLPDRSQMVMVTDPVGAHLGMVVR